MSTNPDQIMDAIWASFREWKERKAHLQHHLDEATSADVKRLLQENQDLLNLIPVEAFMNDSPRVCDLRQALKEAEEEDVMCRLIDVCRRLMRNIDDKLFNWTK